MGRYGVPLFRMMLRLAGLLVLLASAAARAEDVLPSWNEGPSRQALIAFVTAATTPGDTFIPPEDRIAVFDNDGCLWAEQPMYVQLAFALDRVRALAPQHPEWKTRQPFKAVLDGDRRALAAAGEHGLAELIAATHAGMTPGEFETIVRDWLAKARHPRFRRPCTELVDQPMLELLAYLRANGFTTWIVSGGGVEFMRPWVASVYGVRPEQVVGSSVKMKYEVRDGRPAIVRLPGIAFIDDKAGKPVGIQAHIGRRPVAAFGNSDGDFQMLEWTTHGTGTRLGLLVHHDDAAREYAYDRQSATGRLARGLDEAPARGWVVVSMQRDWKRIFAFEP